MIYKIKNDGRDLIPIGEIESLVVSADQKSVTVFRNFLMNALTSGKIKPRNSYGFQVDLLPHFQLNADRLDDLTDNLVREISRPRSITDIVNEVDPQKVKRLVRSRMERESKEALKGTVLVGFLSRGDIGAFLDAHGIGHEWVVSERDPNLLLEATNSQSAPETGKQPMSDEFDLSNETGIAKVIIERWNEIKTKYQGSTITSLKIHTFLLNNPREGERHWTLKTVRNTVSRLKKKGLPQ